jgi:hypothetical protein
MSDWIHNAGRVPAETLKFKHEYTELIVKTAIAVNFSLCPLRILAPISALIRKVDVDK